MSPAENMCVQCFSIPNMSLSMSSIAIVESMQINTVILVLTVGSIVRVKRKAVVNMDNNSRALVM